MDTIAMTEIDHLKRVINDSSELSKRGDNKGALELLDRSIAEAIREGRSTWVRMLTRHAAVISDYMGDLTRTKSYYEQALEHDPENAITLGSLADVLRRLGESDLAKQYAAKSYRLSTQRRNELDRGLVESLLKTWPELGDQHS